MMPSTTLRAGRPAVAPGSTATLGPEARGLLITAHIPFDRLRGAMEDGDASLFTPLQAALIHLVKVGHSFEVPTYCVT